MKKGLGYYRDVCKFELRLDHRLHPLIECEVVQVKISEVLGIDSNDAKGKCPMTCPRRRGTRTGRKATGDGHGPERRSDDSVTTKSKWHVENGMFAFGAVNLNCWPKVAD